MITPFVLFVNISLNNFYDLVDCCGTTANTDMQKSSDYSGKATFNERGLICSSVFKPVIH